MNALASLSIRSRARPSWPLIALLALLGPRVGVAQTPITAVGLGYPVAPIDGRAAGLGGTGIGLVDGTFSLVNPADLTRHGSPGFGLAFSGERLSLEDGSSIDTGRERFTVVRAVAPFGPWALAIAFGSEFDQDWSVRFTDTLALEDGTTVPFEEAREHDGGISSIDVSVARRLGSLSIGLSGQRYTGALRRSFTRSFEESEDGGPPLGAAGGAQRLTYRAWRLRAGAAVTVADRFMASGVLSLGGDLTVDPDDVDEESVDVDLPGTVELGASARLTDRWILAASGGWAEWSVVDEVRDATAHDALWGGVGVEYRGLRLLGGDFPVRLGGRRAELPFSLGPDPVVETAITGGFGWIFREGTAALQVGIEIGKRGDLEGAGLEESFRRATISFELRQR